MTDHGRTLEFGTFLFPNVSDAGDLIGVAQLAEELGYDFVAAPDHPYRADYVENWTLLSAIVGATESIRVFPDVVNLALRQPAVIAKSAWTLNALAPGRIYLGLGTGALWDEIAAIGGPVWSPRDAFEHIEEAVEVIRLFWSGEPEVSFAGQHYRLTAATPPPLVSPAIPLWIGCAKPKMRRLIARSADGWIPNNDEGIEVENLTNVSNHLDEELVAAGRQPADVRRMFPSARKKIQARSERFLFGPPEQWVEELTMLALELGFDTFIFGDREAPVDHVRQIAAEVIPQVKANVAAARGTAPVPAR